MNLDTAGHKVSGDGQRPMCFQDLILDVLCIYNKLVLVGYVAYNWCKKHVGRG